MPADEQRGQRPPKHVLGADDVRRAITRMAHEIIERNRGLVGVALIGIQTGGVWLAESLGAEIARIESAVPVGSLDASLYRDDIGLRPVSPGAVSDLTFDVDGATVVLVDDVLFTGRTVRPRSTRSSDYGRPPRCNSRCSSTAATASCRSGPTTSARTCRPAPTRRARHRRRRGDLVTRAEPAPRRSLLSIDELGPDGVAGSSISPTTWPRSTAARTRRCPALRGKTVCNVFFEDSTRTRLSFETAAKRLSADTMTFAVAQSSLNKGESLRDTIETIAAMGVDAFVIRHGSSGAPWLVENWTDASVVNAGDGWHAHPTQALLDCYTVRTALNRTAGSTGCASRSSATSSTAASPAAPRPRSVRSAPTSRSSRRGRCSRRSSTSRAPTRLDDLIGDVDVLYLLRMQRERMHEALVPSLREYTARFGLTPERAARLPEHALVMHPGPMNRGVEMAVDPAELPGAVVTSRSPTASRCGWRCCSTCSARAPTRCSRKESRMTILITRRNAARSDGTARRRPDLRRPDRRGRRGVGQATTTVSTPPVWSSAPASSTCTPTCASRAGGGRDDRDRQPGGGARRVHGRGRDAEHRPDAGLGQRRRVRPRAGGRPGCARSRRPARSRSGGPASSSRRSPSWPTSACGSSPTTATASRTRC